MTCAKCPAELWRGNKTGLCAKCSQAQQSKDRTKKEPLTESIHGTPEKVEVEKVVEHRIRTLADLVKTCEIDLTEWEIERWVCNKWEMGSVNRKSGATQTTPLFQVKVWLKRKAAVMAAREEIADLLAEAKKAMHDIPVRAAKRTAPSGDHMLQINIFDLHAGKLAWGRETGYASYDTKIAQRLFEEAVEALVARTAAFGFREVLLPIGNDLLNIDNKANTTTKGTPQSTDGRYPKTFVTVRRMLTAAAERLRLVAPVKIIVVPGNHDTLAAWHLGDSLECLFHAREDIAVDNEPTMRKYHEFGKVMLMFTHGDKGKRENYPLLMATERPEMFGRTRFREAHTGHLHQVRLQEHNGVRVRISPALCPPDAWHSENQFVGQQRAAEAFVWHAEEGLVSMATFTVPEPTEKK